MPISKNQIKLITSLQQKKYRVKEGLFVVEGIKVVAEFLKSNFELESVFCTQDVLEKYQKYNPTIVNEVELKKISSLKSPNKVLTLFKIKKNNSIATSGLKVVLDDVNDPGNLGTIIRLCDWFGIEDLVCSKNTVDCYNAKVVQSTMGSLTRVKISYVDLAMYFNNTTLPIYITDMIGEDIYTSNLPQNGIIVMGNEANGISSEIKTIATNTISIPRFGSLQATESLNVATATAIVLSEFKRSIETLG